MKCINENSIEFHAKPIKNSGNISKKTPRQRVLLSCIPSHLTNLFLKPLHKMQKNKLCYIMKNHPKINQNQKSGLEILQSTGTAYRLIRQQWLDGYLNTSGLIGVLSHSKRKRAQSAHVISSNECTPDSIITGSNVCILSSRKEPDMTGFMLTLLVYSTTNQMNLFSISGQKKSVVVKYARSRKKEVQLST